MEPLPTAAAPLAEHEESRTNEVSPYITRENAAEHMPPNLKGYRSAASRAPGSSPARWFEKMTGDEWDGSGHSYEVAKKRHRRLLGGEYSEKERERDKKRDRIGRKQERERDPDKQSEYKRTWYVRYHTDERFRERRERHEAEREERKAERKAQREQEDERRAAALEERLRRHERCGEHFAQLLMSAGVQRAEMFMPSAKSSGLWDNLVNADLSPCSCPEEELVAMTKTLADWMLAYHEVMNDHKEMLVQSEIGSRVVTGGGVDPLATGAFVRQGELPDIFALTDEQFDKADYDTLDAAHAAALMREPIIDGSRLGWCSKTRHTTGWRHVREATQSKFAGEWNYTRMTPPECLCVCDVCSSWLQTQSK